MTNPVFFATPGALAATSVGALFRLDGAEGRHAATVKRLVAGERLDVVDGGGLRVTGEVVSASAGVLELRVLEVRREPVPAHRLVLVQALAKGNRDELAIETATELGVDAVVPWQAERSIVLWKGERKDKAQAKWVSTVTAAAKQARRASIPDVLDAVDLGGLSRLASAAGLAVVLHEEASSPLRELVAAAQVPEGAPILLIVGPEGGVSPHELEVLTAAGARAAVLGPHVLRSSTAGPAAIAVLADQLGRW